MNKQAQTQVKRKTDQPLNADLYKIALLENSVRDFLDSHDVHASASIFQKLKPKPYHFVYPSVWQIALRNLLPHEAMTPDFACTGAEQSLDDLLAHYVMQHPCVALPLSKNLSLIPVYKEKFIKAQLASKKQGEKISRRFGLAKSGFFSSIQPSTSWIYWLKSLNPNMRIVLCLRNPVDRVLDHWAWNKMLASEIMKDPIYDELPGLSATLKMEMDQTPECGNGMNFFIGVGATGYLRHSIYLPFIKELHNVFGSDSVMIVDANELKENHTEVIQKVYGFLSLPEYIPQKMENIGNPPERFRNLHDEQEVRRDLLDFFKPYNEQLYAYLETDFKWEAS